MARKNAKKPIILTAGQKAAATKRANGLDLKAVAAKAAATRLARSVKAARETRAAEMARAKSEIAATLAKAAKKAARPVITTKEALRRAGMRRQAQRDAILDN